MFPHEKRENQSHGGSPGNGTTPANLARTPLATEGEATPGPDDYNPYEDPTPTSTQRRQPDLEVRDPTAGDDPFVFDDTVSAVADVSLPGLDGDVTLPQF